jgi:hypothetical protein
MSASGGRKTGASRDYPFRLALVPWSTQLRLRGVVIHKEAKARPDVGLNL